MLGILSGIKTKALCLLAGGAAPAEDQGWSYKLYSISEDFEFFRQSKKPDNIPILILIVLLVFFLYLSFKQAFRNDKIIARLEKNPELALKHHRKWEPYHKSWPKKLHVWPYLLRIEFVGALVVFAFLMVWSLLLNAPLEEPSNPAFTPNPSKAPWYFLGLQELLVYFDPWIAGVILPGVIVVGLMAIPYIDVNKRGNGYYTFRQRRFSVTTYLIGFIVLWVGMVFLGTYMRGPGWQLFLPWETWDPHRVTHELNLDLNELFRIENAPKGLPQPLSRFFTDKSILIPTLFGAVAFHVMFLSLFVFSWFGFKKFKPKTHDAMSMLQKLTCHLLNAGMYFVVLKMVLRLAFAIKYIWVVPGVFNV